MTGSLIVGVDAGCTSLRDADLLIHRLVEALDLPGDTVACTHLVGADNAHVALSFALPPTWRDPGSWRRVAHLAGELAIVELAAARRAAAATLVGAGPVGAELVGAGLAGPGPVGPGPVGAGPAGAGPAETGLVGASPVGGHLLGGYLVGGYRAGGLDGAAAPGASTGSMVEFLAVGALVTGPVGLACGAERIGPPELADGAAQAVADHAGRQGGRAVVYPGVGRLRGTVLVETVLGQTAVGRVVVPTGQAEPRRSDLLRTRNHVRPVWRDGVLTLVAAAERGRVFTPSEVPHPSPVGGC
ncbi:hypothetical protein [Frankia sp. AvcI1]|uniref:hypothetical protein n=1 Tax=Frankia sp. AvcI1 TaxID=573496 RepID=UPI0006EBFE67|nr:hypothetical protein [Frankia sp. AvcI1]